jgi:hypothetical protein
VSCKTCNSPYSFRNCSIKAPPLLRSQRQVIAETQIDRAALSSSLPRPRTILRPPCTAWRPFLFQLQSCSPYCPPRTGQPVDKSPFTALCDSKSMRPLIHQADTLRRKAEPETGKQSGTERMQDHQISRQSVARLGMWRRRWVRRKRISCAADRKKSNAR